MSTRRALETLEPRLLFTGTPIATIQDTLDDPTQPAAIDFSIAAGDFALIGDSVALGIEVFSNGGSLDRGLWSVTDALGGTVGLIEGFDSAAASDPGFGLFDLPAGDYQVQLTGDATIGGAYEIQVSLAGDLDADFDVDQVDRLALRDLLDAAGYDPAADANRDGLISSFDLSVLLGNLDESTPLTPLTLDADFGLGLGTPLPDGSLPTSDPQLGVTGITTPGAAVELDIDGDGLPDDATTADLGDGSFSLSGTLRQGFNPVSVTAYGTGGFGQRITRSNAVTLQSPLPALVSISPADGETLVNTRREAIITFDTPVDPDTVTPDSFYAIANGSRVPGSIRVASTGLKAYLFYNDPLPASTEVRLVVDGDLITDTEGNPIDADNDGDPGGVATADFSTLPLSRIPGTVLTGYVYDSQNRNPDGSNKPIIGATLTLEGLPEVFAVTDENGFFELGIEDNDGDGIPDGLPSPDFFVFIDGSTATNAPEGGSYAYLGKPLHSIPGQNVGLFDNDGNPFDIFLPVVQNDAFTALSDTETTAVGFGQSDLAMLGEMMPGVDPEVFARTRVNIAPGSALNDDGTPATQAFIVPVDPSRLPAPLPPTLNPELVISVQAPGASNFDTPASVTFPNLEGKAPGEKVLLFSFDHDKGKFVVNGTATVDPDGLTVTTDAGVGIAAPGWHFTVSGEINIDRISNLNNSDRDYNLIDEVPQWLLDFGLTPAKGAMQSVLTAYFAAQPSLLGISHLNHFLRGSGSTLTYGTGSSESNQFKVLEKHIDQRLDIQDFIVAEINRRASLPDPSTLIELTRPQISLIGIEQSENPNLFWGIGGTQGVSVEGEVSVDENGRITGNLTFTYEDTYGFGENDTWLTNNDISFLGKTANQVLRGFQLAGVARPFRTKIVISEEIQGFCSSCTNRLHEIRSEKIMTVESDIEREVVSTTTGFGSDDSVYYRYSLPDGVQVSGTTRPGVTSEQVILPPNTDFRAVFYQPSTNSWQSTLGTSGISGSVGGYLGRPGVVELNQFGGFDTDGDGLPDIGEFAIGTSSQVTDTDEDGIIDSSEIAQGLNPLDGFAAATGTVASLDIFGQAKGLTTVGDPDAPERQTIFAATGTHGLAIIDATRFNNPIIQGQLDLPGDNLAVAVDALSGIALVASTVGLHRVDVSDPMTPTLIETIDLLGGSRAVAIFGDTAYVGNGNAVIAIDVTTGERIQTLSLGSGGEVAGLTREGGTLFAMQNSGQLSSIGLNAGGMVLLDRLSMNGAGGQIFAGDGVVYAAGVQTGQGGYLTADTSDPSNLVLLSDEDIPFGTVIPGSGIVLNGSGLGLLVGSGGGQGFLELMDVSDPTNNFQRTGLAYRLPGTPTSVAIAGGLAFVSTGASGVQVVNYLPFDADGVPPTVTVAEPADELPGEDGIQVQEGRPIPLDVAVNDDVQVRNVELIVDGQVVANALSFPWNLELPAQTFDPEGDNLLEVQVRATDTGGNAALSEAITLQIIPDLVPPTLVSVSPSDGSTRTLDLSTLRLGFSEPMDESTLTSATIRLISTEPGSTPIVPESLLIRDEGASVQLTIPELGPGDYVIELVADQITDASGNALGAGVEVVSTFTVIDSQLPDIIPTEIGPVALGANDDGSTGLTPMGFTLDLFGQTFDNFYINNNGNITFNSRLSAFTASGFPQSQPIIAPFWADVDTRGAGSGVVHLNQGVSERGNNFTQVTWNGVGYFPSETDKLNTFTLYMEDDVAGDIVGFFYGDMQWTTGSASGGSGGFGGTGAQIGFDSGDGENFISFARPSTAQEVADISGRSFVFRLTEEFLGTIGGDASTTPSILIPGDTDGDGDIDDGDLGTAFANFTGPAGAAGGKTAAEGDTDGDGDIDDSDLANAFANFTGPLSPALPVKASDQPGLSAADRQLAAWSDYAKPRPAAATQASSFNLFELDEDRDEPGAFDALSDRVLSV